MDHPAGARPGAKKADVGGSVSQSIAGCPRSRFRRPGIPARRRIDAVGDGGAHSRKKVAAAAAVEQAGFHAAFLKAPAGVARAQVVPSQLFGEVFVTVDDPVTFLDVGFRGESSAAFTAPLERRTGGRFRLRISRRASCWDRIQITLSASEKPAVPALPFTSGLTAPSPAGAAGAGRGRIRRHSAR